MADVFGKQHLLREMHTQKVYGMNALNARDSWRLGDFGPISRMNNDHFFRVQHIDIQHTYINFGRIRLLNLILKKN